MFAPLSKRLHLEELVRLAELQDRFVDALYSLDKDLVMHGGTAVWRCYGGNRFSYDIDGYFRSEKEIRLAREKLTWELSKRGARLDRINEIGDSMVLQVSSSSSRLKVEIKLRRAIPRPVLRGYEKTDGSFLSVLTFTPEQLILEKIDAYERRRYIRDLYDVFYLMDRVSDWKIVGKKLKLFVSTLKPPVDQHVLSNLIYSGVAPTYADMRKYILSKIR